MVGLSNKDIVKKDEASYSFSTCETVTIKNERKA